VRNKKIKFIKFLIDDILANKNIKLLIMHTEHYDYFNFESAIMDLKFLKLSTCNLDLSNINLLLATAIKINIYSEVTLQNYFNWAWYLILIIEIQKFIEIVITNSEIEIKNCMLKTINEKNNELWLKLAEERKGNQSIDFNSDFIKQARVAEYEKFTYKLLELIF
jgi:hypothetical protein